MAPSPVCRVLISLSPPPSPLPGSSPHRPLPDAGDEPPPLPCWFNFGGPLLSSHGFPSTPLGSP
ncbi:hypothetical protein HanRHA438_Chr12g0544141 [Helianthus annuus]|nr:hypothetical protein HanRHA438_Chr12g0544141 [Helianthus annuus]